ncbi:hypothetical protein V8C42DRAFT_319844 [Trichoderma barbatum]
MSSLSASKTQNLALFPLPARQGQRRAANALFAPDSSIMGNLMGHLCFLIYSPHPDQYPIWPTPCMGFSFFFPSLLLLFHHCYIFSISSKTLWHTLCIHGGAVTPH